MKLKILAVDDEPDALELIAFNLKNAGFDVITAEDGKAALNQVRRKAPDLVILDLMLPEIDGLELCKTLRKDLATASIPIIMLTARAAEIDRVLGLELGADDYVTKPFSPRELVLRVKKLLDRRGTNQEQREQFKVGELLIELPATEFKLAAILAERCGRVQNRDQLLRDAWEYTATIDTRTVDTHVRRLREKLGPAAKYLETVRGV